MTVLYLQLCYISPDDSTLPQLCYISPDDSTIPQLCYISPDDSTIPAAMLHITCHKYHILCTMRCLHCFDDNF